MHFARCCSLSQSVTGSCSYPSMVQSSICLGVEKLHTLGWLQVVQCRVSRTGWQGTCPLGLKRRRYPRNCRGDDVRSTFAKAVAEGSNNSRLRAGAKHGILLVYDQGSAEVMVGILCSLLNVTNSAIAVIQCYCSCPGECSTVPWTIALSILPHVPLNQNQNH